MSALQSEPTRRARFFCYGLIFLYVFSIATLFFLFSPERIDYQIYVAAGERVLVDEALYERVQSHIRAKGSLELYIYPPTVAFGFALARSFFTSTLTQHLWLVVSFAAGFLFASGLGRLLLLRWKSLDPWWAQICAMAMVFLFNPFIRSLGLGQIDPIIAALMVWTMIASLSGREVTAGILIAIAGLLKVTPFGWLMVFVALAQWRSVLGVILSSGVILGFFSLLGFPFEYWLEYSRVVPLLSDGGILGMYPNNFAPVAAVCRLGALASCPRGMSLLMMGLVALVLYWWLREDILKRPLLTHLVFSVGLVLMPPLVWGHHFLWLLPALALVPSLSLRSPTAAFSLSILFYLILGQVENWLNTSTGGNLEHLVRVLPGAVMVLMIALGVHGLRLRPKSGP